MRPVSFRGFLSLIRYKVSIAVTFSAYASALICRGRFSLLDLLPMSGIFLLAAGASVMNQFQEHEYDARMTRTKNRPIPLSEISPANALSLSILFICAGLALLAIMELWITLLLGVINVAWYNGFYTWLKRKTAFAVVPGAMTGAIPIMMGWTSAGGLLYDPLPVFMAFFIFLWQVPHFWLLSLIHDNDYRKAGFPVVSDLFTRSQMKKVLLAWILAASSSSVLMTVFGIIVQEYSIIFILILNLILVLLAVYYLFISKTPGYRFLFLQVNIFSLIVFIVIISDNMI